MVHGSDPFKDALKRPITTIPPSITTTHHDGGLPSPLSYTLADDDPPLPSTRTQRLRQNLRERNQFRNDGWTKWEAVQLADELEATRAKAKADWECRKEADKQREALDLQINGPFLFVFGDLSESEEALRDADKHLRQKRNPYKEEAKNVCARLHSGIMLSVINEVDNNSMKGDDNNKGNGDKKMSIGGSGFSVPSPGYNCKGGTVLMDFRSSLDNVDGDGNNNDSTAGIRGLNINSKILSEEEAEDACVVSHKENGRRIDIGEDDNNNNHVHDNKSNNDNNDNEIPLKIQGADLRR